MNSVKERVRKRRNREQIMTAIRARRFTGLETLAMGLKMSNLALKLAGSRKHD
jgi:hypothetical protein